MEDIINDYLMRMAIEESLRTENKEEEKKILSQDEINRNFPLVYIEDKTECSICLRDVDVGSRMRKLPCEHYFCRKCIDPYFMNKEASCPNCRFKIINSEI